MVHGTAQLHRGEPPALAQRGLDAVENLGDDALWQPVQDYTSSAVAPQDAAGPVELLQCGAAGGLPRLVMTAAEAVHASGQAPTGGHRAGPQAWARAGRAEARVAGDEVLDALVASAPRHVAAQAQAVGGRRAAGAGGPAHRAQALPLPAGPGHALGAEGIELLVRPRRPAMATAPAQPVGPTGLVGAALHPAHGIVDQAMGRVEGEHESVGVPPEPHEPGEVEQGRQPVVPRPFGPDLRTSTERARRRCHPRPVGGAGPKGRGARRSTASRMAASAGCR